MRMTLGLVVAATIALTGAAHGQEAVVKTRKAIMQVNQSSSEVLVGMLRGNIPFDAAIAGAAFSAISQDNEIFPTFFPDGSDTANSGALPTVWSNRDEFVALSMKMSTDAATAAQEATSPEALGPLLTAIGRNCANCHGRFRQD